MRSLLITITCCLLTTIAFNQAQIDVNVSPLKSVDILELPALDNQQLQKRYKNEETKSTALRFAEARDINITPQKHGTWEQTKDNKLVWRQIIVSPNAHTINLAFTKFYLPESAQLFIYNTDKTEVIGPITFEDNDDHLQYWTPLITGEKVVVELQIAPEDKNDYTLELSRVNHDFINIQKSFSGSCNVDVVCGAEDGFSIVDEYRDIIRSAGAYTVGGIDFCSGTLMNNVRQDFTPYFLTADHCGVRANNAASMVVFWNYQNSTCRQPGSVQSGGIGNGLRNQFNSGARFRATLNDSDFTLVELDDPVDRDFNLFFSGWNRGAALTDTSICVHHPGVEEKRISFDFDGLAAQNTHVRVFDWDIGTTEGGSSGSGLYNTRGELIGQLTGGLAACGNNDFDIYGWVNYSWDRGPNSSSQLGPWLDPDNTGVMALNGIDGNFNLLIDQMSFDICGSNQDNLEIAVTAEGQFEGPINFSVGPLPNNISANFDSPSGIEGQENRLVVSGLSSAAEGRFDIIIIATDGTNTVESAVTIDISQDIPSAPTQNFPLDGATGLGLEVEIVLNRRTVAFNEFQVSTDENFNNLIVNERSDVGELIVEDLQSQTTYFWRARSGNSCGLSDWTEARSFTTSEILCAIINYLGESVTIGSNDPNTVRSEVELPYVFQIENIDINQVSGTHTFISDIDSGLEFGGALSVLFTDLCFADDNFNLGFSDDSNLNDIPCPPTSGDIFVPFTPLDVFNGLIATGTWELIIDDTASQDGGSLDAWSMDVCYSNPIAPIIVPSNNIIMGCNNTQMDINVYVDAGNQNPDFEVRVIGGNGNEITSSLRPIGNDPTSMILALVPSREEGGLSTIEILNGNNVEFSTQIRLDLEDGGAQAITRVPQSGARLNNNQFNQISWDTQGFTGDYIVEVSRDENFNEIELSFEGSNGGNIAVDATALEDGVYYIRIGQEGDCGFVLSDVVIINLDSTVSTFDEQNTITATLFPNPGNGIFNLNTESTIPEDTEIRIFDVQGKTYLPRVSRKNDRSLQLEMSEFPTGMYYLELTNKDLSIKKKLIKI
jgi:hypothetical protein